MQGQEDQYEQMLQKEEEHKQASREGDEDGDDDDEGEYEDEEEERDEMGAVQAAVDDVLRLGGRHVAAGRRAP